MPLKRLLAADHLQVPWKNGLGVSRILASDPPGAPYDTLRWQVGATAITADSPFSLLPDLDRLFMVVEGAGVELKSIDENGATRTHPVYPLRPYAFRGDWMTECRLLDGPVKVLNVIARRGQARATLELLQGNELSKPAKQTVIAVDLSSLDAWRLDGPGEERAAIERGTAPVARISLSAGG
jgi:environmental stress-induced protein Ves